MESTEKTFAARSNTKNCSKGTNRTTKILLAIIAVLVLIIAGLVIWYFMQGKDASRSAGTPLVRINTPARAKAGEDIAVPVTLSDMPEGVLYPAVSFSLVFDNYKLELVGLEQGSIRVLADENPQGNSLALPEWKLNRDFANQSGHINVMYFDSTAGRYAFTSDGFDADSGNTLFTLIFRLRNSVKSGEIFDILMEDACFAASDESLSLAMTQKTLIAENGKIIVG